MDDINPNKPKPKPKQYVYTPVERLVNNADPSVWEELPEWEDLSDVINDFID